LGNKKNILVCPLDWGLGHASRCIPIISQLKDEGHKIIIATSGRALLMLKNEFPKLEFLEFFGYNVSYPSNDSMVFKMFRMIPSFFLDILTEHRELKKIIKKESIDVVISDHRYGLWNKNVKSILIIHQVMIKCPRILKFMEISFYFLTTFFMKKFSECWIPDVEEKENLSGELSHKYKLPANTRFIGHLSRFYNKNLKLEHEYSSDLLIILSGPEPQRTIFEEIIFVQLKDTKLKTIVIRGLPEEDKKYFFANHIQVFSSVPTDELTKYLFSTRLVICRSGYSSIMDLIAMKKNALLVPTPGQTEQEYLAKYLFEKNIFYFVKQKYFNLITNIENAERINAKFNFCNFEKLNEIVKSV